MPVLTSADWHGGPDLKEPMKSEPLTAATIAKADCVVILTDHCIVDYAMVQHSAKAIVDTRNAIAGHHANVFRLGAPSAGSKAAMRMPSRLEDDRGAQVVA